MSKPQPERCVGILNDDIIRKEFLLENGKINSMMIRRCLNGRELNAKQYIENRYSDSKSWDESLRRILYHIDVHPVCKICGGEVKFGYRSFNPTCSQSCAQKYSDKNLRISKEGQLICEQKRKIALNKKYGVNNPGQLDSVKAKVKQTCIEKYGVENVFQIPEFKDKMKKLVNSEEFKQKCYETHKRNNSFHTSKTEDKVFQILLTKFPEVIRQYKEERYPFMCDFYVPSEDLFIELNYHWTHGKKLFENSEKDNLFLNKWKSKDSKYYKNAIYTWTILDVQKYNKAKENNLNYLAFYNEKEFKKWFENI